MRGCARSGIGLVWGGDPICIHGMGVVFCACAFGILFVHLAFGVGVFAPNTRQHGGTCIWRGGVCGVDWIGGVGLLIWFIWHLGSRCLFSVGAFD